MSINQNFPSVRPSLNLNFARSKKLDSRITFTRGSTGTYVDDNGLIRTAGINQPRFDHDPTNLKSLGLLIEEARTNLFLQSTSPDNLVSPWIKGPNTTRVGTVTSPDGTSNAINYSGDGSGSNEYVGQQSISLSSSTTYTVSIWAKVVSGSAPTSGQIITTEYNNGSGIVRAFIDFNGNITTEWKRFSVTFTNVTGGSFSSYFIADQNNTSQIAIWGAQIEAGEFQTSYIPTVASTVTRSADDALIDGTNFSSWYNQTEGTYVTSARYDGSIILGVTNKTVFTGFSTSGRLYWNALWGGNNRATWVVEDPPGTYFTIISSGDTISIGDTRKTAAVYKLNDYAFSANGNVPTTNTSGTITSTAISLYIGTGAIGGLGYLNGRIEKISYYPKRLTNTQLQELTK